MVVDQRRIEQKRDGFLPFIIHEDWEPPKWTHRDIGGTVMTEVAKLLELRILQVRGVMIQALDPESEFGNSGSGFGKGWNRNSAYYRP